MTLFSWDAILVDWKETSIISTIGRQWLPEIIDNQNQPDNLDEIFLKKA